MPTGGLTNTGYVASTVDEEVQDLNAKVLANVDGALDLSSDQPFGQVIGIFAEKFAELQELGATVYDAIDPDAAEGRLLANVCSISGTFPQVATFSKVVVNMVLNPGTTVFAGATMRVNGQPSNVWVLEADVTNSTAGVATLFGTFRSNLPGPFVANANTLQVIGTPTIGWLSGTNVLDATPGLAGDTDTTLRTKRLAQILGEGSGDLDAIRAAVLRVGGVIQCFVYENTSLVTDSNGLPGKAFRVVIWDGPGLAASNDQVAQAIWNAKPSGILSYGTTATGNAIDSTGQTRVIQFDRAVQVPIYLVLTTTPGTLTLAQRTAVKAALKAYGDANYNLGVSVIDVPLRAAAVVPGVTTDVPTFFLGTTPSPTGTSNIPIGILQIATLDTTNMLVNGL